MTLLDKLKRIFKFNKNEEELKLITNGDYSEKAKQFKDTLCVDSVNYQKQPSLEDCIDEFIKQYRIQEEYNPNGSKKAYHAYSRMFCGEEKAGDNVKNQKRLIKLVKKNGCNTNYQTSNNRMVFMHISGKEGIDEYKDSKMEKIYINCDRSDISIVTAAIFKQIKDIAGDKLQMKCVSEQLINGYGLDEDTKEIKNYQRNDRIVIYTENHEKTEEICNAISLLKHNNPKIFKGIKSIPILQNKDGFMLVADKSHDNLHVKTPIGDASGATFNDYVSDILYQSVIAAFDQELMVDSDSYNLKERMAEYARIYPEMVEEQKKRILDNSLEIFKNVCKDANIELNDKGQQVYQSDIEK